MIDNDTMNLLYKSNKEMMARRLQEIPTAIKPIVTQSDVENRFIIRYFVRPANEPDYITEIDKRQYELFKKNPRFVVTSINWKIVGSPNSVEISDGVYLYGVRDINKQSIINMGLTFGNLSSYITDYLDLWVSME